MILPPIILFCGKTKWMASLVYVHWMARRIVWAIAIAIVIIVFVVDAHKSREKERRLEKLQNELMELFDIFIKYTAKHNLRWWASDGTLLGAVREKSIIKWDDDIDVTAPSETVAFLRSKTSELRDMGLKFELADHIWRFKWDIPDGVYIDMFEMQKDKDGKWRYTDEIIAKRWNHVWFDDSEVAMLTQYKFGNLTIPGPSDPAGYLKRMYGDWQTPAVQNGHHIL